MISDALNRQKARDPERSVIVQAPAGSGKTELLMQRYLGLLARVDEPEHILAVTFTRKAAAEMRERILNALQCVNDAGLLPETRVLAEQALQQNRHRDWQLLHYPARLRIRTFDAVNSWLTDCAPLSSPTAAAKAQVTEQVNDAYQLAGRRTLELIADKSGYGPLVQTLLRHLDNSTGSFIALIARMLACRDQWLPLLGSGALTDNAREGLEQSLRELVARELRSVSLLLDRHVVTELVAVLPYAAACLRASQPESPLRHWLDCNDFPSPDPDNLQLWQAIADLLLLKNTDELRSKLNKTQGFPTVRDGGDTVLNQRANALLGYCSNTPGLAAALGRVRMLPAPVYDDKQWDALAALLKVLPVAAAQLRLVFSERTETDYMEIAGEALAALGEDEAPTGLALRLDYRIQHILIDEFQDTSRAQFRLLQRLTSGWDGTDGRTLMVVGDPMQSIYRFRQAEVGLFMELWHSGLDALILEPITLSTNFRSDPTVVEWVNRCFTQILPALSDAAVGAVPFAPGVAHRAEVAGSGVELHLFERPARVNEAYAVAEIVQQALSESSTGTIGILVRTRNQARLIAPALRERGIRFSGEGLEVPGESSVEQDLLALARALSHQGDRTAWLALLRAPWCGLSLADLEQLCGGNWQSTVREQLGDDQRIAQLSVDGQQRVQAFRVSIEAILGRAGQTSMRDWVEGAWQQLGGPAALKSRRELDLASQVLDTLDTLESGGSLANAWRLDEQLARREDSVGHEPIRVHLLTVFKAKGLEYDTVIVPALDGRTRGNERQALVWHEFQGASGTDQILLAPIEATGSDNDRLRLLIQRFEGEQLLNERNRLLYVATTRAKSRLHLCAEIRRNRDGEVLNPPSGSLLASLWPAVANDCREFAGPPGTAENRERWTQPRIQRFCQPLTLPAAPAAIEQPVAVLPGAAEDAIPYDWAGAAARCVGIVVHRCLEFIAGHRKAAIPEAKLVEALLCEEGVCGASLAACCKQVQAAIANTLNDAQGQWILQSHSEAANEYSMSLWQQGERQRLVIDRTFVTADGVRWIIDYKTSRHTGGNLKGFIDNEMVRYQAQLQSYVEAFQLMEPERHIRAGLYFPLLGEFREWQPLFDD